MSASSGTAFFYPNGHKMTAYAIVSLIHHTGTQIQNDHVLIVTGNNKIRRKELSKLNVESLDAQAQSKIRRAKRMMETNTLSCLVMFDTDSEVFLLSHVELAQQDKSQPGKKGLFLLDLDRLCKVCDEEAKMICSGCKAVRYCSLDCQTNDWKTHHKQDCKKFKLLEHKFQATGLKPVLDVCVTYIEDMKF